MQIETTRLLLREMREEDYDALYAIFSDAETMRYYPAPFSTEKVKHWIEKNQMRYQVFGFGLWSVVQKDDGKVIGDCGITMQQIDDAILPEIGYHIDKHLQNQGYATEAARACRDEVFRLTPFQRLYAYMDEQNMASRRVAEHLGMRCEKTYTDVHAKTRCVYALDRLQKVQNTNDISLEKTDDRGATL